MQLSADAVPALIEVMPTLSAQDQAQVRNYLLNTNYRLTNWRSFHFGRWWANQAISEMP